MDDERESIADHKRIGFMIADRAYRRVPPSSTRPPALVVGEDGANALAVIRALGCHGVRVSVAATGPSRVLRSSRFCDNVYPLVQHDSRTNEAILAHAADLLRDTPVLICCNDRAIELVAEVAKLVNDRFRPVTNTMRAAALLDKRRQHEIAQDAGVPVPLTFVTESIDELVSSIDDLPYPVICKPWKQVDFARFPKVLILHDEEQARRELLPVLSDPIPLLIQEYLVGRDSDVEVLMGLCNANGALLHWVCGRKIRQYPPGAGVMASGQTIDSPELVDCSRRILAQAKVNGLIGLEFKRSEATGALHFIEMSLRPENFIGLAVGSGVNLPYLAYLHALGREVPAAPPTRRATWICSEWDLACGINGIRRREHGLAPYLASLRGPRVWATFSWSDPLPWFHSTSGMMSRRIAQFAGGMRTIHAETNGRKDVNSFDHVPDESPELQQAHDLRESVGIVVIGRNEGELLHRALASLPTNELPIIYVDSGSDDDSVSIAESFGIDVLELDPSRPFSAARARQEGAALLLDRHPELHWVQFVDGDCVLHANWLDRGSRYLLEHNDVAIVCGHISEHEPNRSVYNRLSALQMKGSTGDIHACGGILLVRRKRYEEVGGFNPDLLTGEEADLCRRIRNAGGRIVRIDQPMATHDAGLHRFGDWWRRAIWGGYGDAIELALFGSAARYQQRKETRSALFWGIALPLIIAVCLVAMPWWRWAGVLAVIGMAACVVLMLRIMVHRLSQGDTAGDATLYAVFCTLRKLPTALGFLAYQLSFFRRDARPDPHTRSGRVSQAATIGADASTAEHHTS